MMVRRVITMRRVYDGRRVITMRRVYNGEEGV